jgi:hypothetical protein
METPKKKTQLSKPTDCVIHCSNSSDALVTLDSHASWKTLLNAAQIRNHEKILEVSRSVEPGGYPYLQYHRRCRSLFTMKRDLEKIKGSSQSGSKVRFIYSLKFLTFLFISFCAASYPS